MNKNTGHGSTGNRSTGDWSTGHGSTGDWSTGHGSTGDWSTGNRSTGDWSTGGWSTGGWSTSNFSTGHFSTIDFSGFGAFDRPCTPEEWDNSAKPSFFYFDSTRWICESEMTDVEKNANPTYKATGGYLRVYDYKEAWLIAWENASEEDKKKLYALPNFDPIVFEKISGINVNERTTKKIVIDGKEIEISQESYDALRKALC